MRIPSPQSRIPMQFLDTLNPEQREAVETLWSCYGAQGLYMSDPLQRHLRDVLAISQHFSFNFDIAGAAYGLKALGGRYANPTM